MRARIVAAMAMRALAYRFWFGGHGLADLRGPALRFTGYDAHRRRGRPRTARRAFWRRRSARPADGRA